uniref:Origin recognition complex subunit 4 n=1 Tax=Mycena chlorophos TaxID=658473 RepID=A0ABQ0KYT1_MYCCL|nr:predicted protein [Mycena chlorophos]
MAKRKAAALESTAAKRVKTEDSPHKVIKIPRPASPTTPRRVGRKPRDDSDDELDVITSRGRKPEVEESPSKRPTATSKSRSRAKHQPKTESDSPVLDPNDTPTRTLRSGRTVSTSPTKTKSSPGKPAQEEAQAVPAVIAVPRKRVRSSTLRSKKLSKPRSPSPVSDSEDGELEAANAVEAMVVGPSVSREPSPEPPAIRNSSPAPLGDASSDIAGCLQAQKREILRLLQNPLDVAKEDETAPSRVAFQQLGDLLGGTVDRGEGNSCLLLGPRGSGKTTLVQQCLANLAEPPIVLRLCGWAQHTDKLAMREIAYQLAHQTGKSFLAADDEEAGEGGMDSAATPAAHLPALISVLPTLARPTVVILDAFDLFAQHPRQALLYCLLDTVQSCRAGTQTKGLAVIGLTSRVDTLNMLEKRVKSRFSGRMFRTTPPLHSRDWIQIVSRVLQLEVDETVDSTGHWQEQWVAGVKSFLGDSKVKMVFKETFSVIKDIRVLVRLLTSLVVHLSPSAPFPTLSHLEAAIAKQRSRPQFPSLHVLPYPGICLLIASIHSEACGHPTFTFEMLYERVRDQIRISTSVPVQFNGSSIGMPQCSRSVLMSAFEGLVSSKMIGMTATSSSGVAKEFVKYRALVGKADLKKALHTKGDITLTKWFTKATQ